MEFKEYQEYVDYRIQELNMKQQVYCFNKFICEYAEFINELLIHEGNGRELPEEDYFFKELGDMLFFIIGINDDYMNKLIEKKWSNCDLIKPKNIDFDTCYCYGSLSHSNIVSFFYNCIIWYNYYYSKDINVEDIAIRNKKKLDERYGELTPNSFYKKDKRVGN